MNASKRNLYILTFVLFVVMLGYGIIIPILPFYIESMGAGGMELGLLVASYAVMRLIFGPIWGGISDRVGRKPILLIGIFGYVLTMTWFGLATQLWMLFAARILSGILSSATAPTTMAYIGDSASEEERGGGICSAQQVVLALSLGRLWAAFWQANLFPHLSLSQRVWHF